MRRIRAILAVSVVAAALLVPVMSASALHHRAPRATAEQNIVDTAVAAGKFKTLTSLLQQAGLAQTLQSGGPYTVFAPTDRAFARVPKATLERLARNRAKLRAVLLYHVAEGRLTAATVAGRRRVKTLNGQSVRIRARDGQVKVGRARVITRDVAASNGVIHVIDRVLIPR